MTDIVVLKNRKTYPFNDSAKAIYAGKVFPDADYPVLTEIVSSEGEIGAVIVSGKMRNGFLLAFTGSARKAVIRYYIPEDWQ